VETPSTAAGAGQEATRSPRPDFPQRGKTHGAQHPDAVHLIGGPGLNLATCGQARTPEKMDPDRPDVITWSPLLTAREELVTCLACLIKLDTGFDAAMDRTEATLDRIEARQLSSQYASRPIHHIRVNGVRIDGDQFEMGSLSHDVATGTVDITFCNVHTLEIIYTDTQERS
jgi:hypothetical protein